MATYIMLSRLTETGAETLKKSPGRILEVNKELSQMGVKVLQQYAVLGAYDFVNIVEAPDMATVMKASVVAGVAAAAVALVSGSSVNSQSRTPNVPRANGKPDLNGLWQAVNTANWDIQAAQLKGEA